MRGLETFFSLVDDLEEIQPVLRRTTYAQSNFKKKSTHAGRGRIPSTDVENAKLFRLSPRWACFVLARY